MLLETLNRMLLSFLDTLSVLQWLVFREITWSAFDSRRHRLHWAESSVLIAVPALTSGLCYLPDYEVIPCAKVIKSVIIHPSIPWFSNQTHSDCPLGGVSQLHLGSVASATYITILSLNGKVNWESGEIFKKFVFICGWYWMSCHLRLQMTLYFECQMLLSWFCDQFLLKTQKKWSKRLLSIDLRSKEV